MFYRFLRLTGLMSLLWLVFSLAACSKTTSQTTNSAEPKVLNVSPEASTHTLDPHLGASVWEAELFISLYEGLMRFDPSGKAVPGLADSYVVSEDGKTYTYHLREGIHFSDGSPITVEDVLFSFRHLVNPKTAAEYSFVALDIVGAKEILAGKQPTETLGVETPDSEHVVVHLLHPVPYFNQLLAIQALVVISKKVVEEYGKYAFHVENAVFSGAYMMTDHVPSSHTTLKRNPLLL